MSADKQQAPSTGYSRVENLDKSVSYHCDFCPESSPDIDAARAHRAVHVAGPELLEAILADEYFRKNGYTRQAVWAFVKENPEHPLWMKHCLNGGTGVQKFLVEQRHAAIAKAAPTKGAVTP